MTGNRFTHNFGDVCVALGSSITTEKVSQISPILEKLGGQKGTLHLEYFADENDVITFDKDELPEAAQEFTDGQTGETAEENQ